MKPTDPRVLRQLAVARKPLAGVLAGGVLASLFVIGQAFALTGVVVAAVRGRDLMIPLVVLTVVVIGKALATAAGDVAAARAAALVGAKMRADLVDAVTAGRASTMTEGEVASLATRGVTAAEPYLTRYVPTLVLAAILPFLTVAVMATQDVMSALIVVATLPLVPVFGALVGLATRDRAESQWRAMASLSGHFVDVMKGLPTLVAFCRADAQSGTIRAITNRYRESTLRTLRIAFASSAVLELVATISVALVAVVVGVRLASGHLDLRTALVVLLLAPEAYWPLRKVGAEFHAAAEGVATFEKMNAVAPTSESTLLGRTPAGHRMLIGTDVTFVYPGRHTPAVASLDLAVPPRAVTAVVGPSGSGKSTVLALMAGLLVPTSGRVTNNGVATSAPEWQSLVAWLPQRPMFLASTVAANLRLGAPEADDERLWDALDRVALAERVRALGGLGALVAEDARNLSAGERARLALARVVVAARPWVLLDEPTAHLDPITQQVLLDVIVELAASSGVVVVAHDPAVVQIADRVISLPDRRAEPEPANPVPGPVRAPVPVLEVVEPQRDARTGGFGLSTFLSVLASLSGVALTATAGWLIVKASAHPATLTLLVAIVGVRTFGLGRPVFRYAERLRSHDAALRMLAERRVQIYEAIVPLTPGRLGKRRGDVLTSIVDDVDSVVDRELRIKLPVRTYAAVVVVAAAVCALVLPVAGLVIAVTSLVGAGSAYAIAAFGTRRPETASVLARAELSTVMLDATHLAPELRMWQAQRVVGHDVRDLSARLGRATRDLSRAVAGARTVLQASSLAGVIGVAVLSRDALSSGAVSAPALALLLLVPVALVDVASGVVDAGAVIGRVAAAQQRLDRFEEMVPAVSEPLDPVAADQRLDVEADRVTFGWNGHAVLADLSFRLAAGSKIGVVGPSGSGKSTLASSLVRFIDPLEGSVSLGGQALPALSLDDVRSAVGYVDDDPHVFATTLVENIRLARPSATGEEVLAALESARLGPWVRSLPEGLDTWLGDGHAQVSGGERARLGLARSLLRDQRVLVLDEPVAHLDGATAAELAADLLDAGDGRTIIWITHSPVGLERMDQVIDLGCCKSPSNVSGLEHV